MRKTDIFSVFAVITLLTALLLVPLFSAFIGKMPPGSPWTPLVMLSPQLVMILGLGVIAFFPPKGSWLQRFELKRPKWGFGKLLGAAVGGMVLMMAVGGLVQLTAHLVGFQLPQTSDIRLLRTYSPPILMMVAFSAVLIAPWTEEFLVRRFLYDGLERFMGVSWRLEGAVLEMPVRVSATILASGLFAVLHFDPVKFLPLLAFGCYLQWVRKASGSMAGPVFVHAFNNFLTVVVLGLVYWYKPLWEALLAQTGG